MYDAVRQSDEPMTVDELSDMDKFLPMLNDYLNRTSYLSLRGRTHLDNARVYTLGLYNDLERAPTVHLVQCGLKVVELEHVRDHALHVDFATVEISDGPREAVGLRKRSYNLQIQLISNEK